MIDKQPLEIVATLRPARGKTSKRDKFGHYGRYDLVSIGETDSALADYGAGTLKEIKRLQMKRPVGKCHVWNKTKQSEGTSH